MLEIQPPFLRTSPLDAALKRNARSFYLSLQVLPQVLKTPISLAYLLARAADTIADDPDLGLDRIARLALLSALETRLRKRLSSRAVSVFRGFLEDVQTHLDGMPELFLALTDCEEAFAKLDDREQDLICEVVIELLGAMFFDLERFEESKLSALEHFADIEEYAYLAAGCVGKFWCALSRDRLRKHGAADAELRAIDYGRALQWTNMLRDIAKDLRNGRCYIPRAALKTVGLEPTSLHNPDNWPIFRPLYRRFLSHAYVHFLNGWRFVEALPHSEYRLRLASSWPALLGMQTLSLLADKNCNPLDAKQPLKIERSEVYQTLLSTSTQFWIPGRASLLFRQRLQDLEAQGIEAKSFVFAAT